MLEIARAGRSVQTPMKEYEKCNADWVWKWDEADALRIAVHMFFADSYEEDNTYMPKNILLRIKDASTGNLT